jgi:DMSO reductase anchor subunit
MHPAPSLILFTVLSGLGFGLMVWLGFGALVPVGWVGFVFWALAYGLAGAGLIAATFHLGHPERAWRAFSQWRSSWLSREGVLSVATFAVMAPHAAASVFLGRPLPALGIIGGALALLTVLSTAMIYAQLRSVPRWHHWTTPAVFLTAALAGGGLLAGQAAAAGPLFALLALALAAHWHLGDRRFAEGPDTPETATGLGRIGRVRLLAPPHTGRNYLLREMVHVVGRKHAGRLRAISLFAGAIMPAVLLIAFPAGHVLAALAVIFHLAGILAARWLFFAEAEHVVGLYYGRR